MTKKTPAFPSPEKVPSLHYPKSCIRLTTETAGALDNLLLGNSDDIDGDGVELL
jgi:hypothetical protein